jgi:integrase
LGDTRRRVATASVNRDLATLRRLLKLARQWKVIDSVPVIRLLSGERGHERVITHAEEDAYLREAPLLLKQFATIMFDTGMRPEGVCRMRWEDVHLEPIKGSRFGYVHNPFGKTKWAKRNLSLTARIQGLLNLKWEAAGKPREGWIFPSTNRRGHVPYSTIDSQHDRTMQKLNAPGPDGGQSKNRIARFRLYDLRHTFLTRLGEANTDAFTIQKIAGHASIVMWQRYVHPTPERIENAFSKLEEYNTAKIQQAQKEVERQQQEPFGLT